MIFRFKKKFYSSHYNIFFKLSYNYSKIIYNFRKIYLYYSISRLFIKRVFKNVLKILNYKFYGYNILIIQYNLFSKNKYFMINKYWYYNFYYEIFFLFNKLIFYIK